MRGMRGRATLRGRLLLAFAAMGLITLCLGAWAARSVQQTGGLVAAIFDNALISTSYARSAAVGFAAMEAALARRRLAADDAARAEQDARLAELAALLDEDLGIAAGRSLSPQAAGVAAAAAASVAAWRAAAAAARGEEGPDWLALDRLAADASERLEVLVQQTAGDGFRQRQRAGAAVAATVRLNAGGTAAALLLGTVVALVLARRIIGPVAAASAAAAGIAAGRLDTPIPAGGRDELGVLLGAMARMRDAIRGTIERERAERRSAQARLADALEGSTEGVVLIDADGRIAAANARAAELLPAAAAHLAAGASWASLAEAALPQFRAAGDPALRAAFGDGAAPAAAAEAPLAAGGWLRVSRSAARDGGHVVILADVTELKAHEAALEATNRQFDAALQNMSQGLVLFGPDDRLRVANQRFLDMHGLAEAQPGTGWAALFAAVLGAAGHAPAEAEALARDRLRFVARRAAGTRQHAMPDGRTIAMSLSPMADGGFVATFEDVTERQRAEARIAHLARHDPLTGLPNRALLQERLAAALAAPAAGGATGGFALHLIDLDAFGELNESHGSPAADRVLRAVAERLLGVLGPEDMAGRLGADQFLVLQHRPAGEAGAEAMAAALLAALAPPHDVDGQEVPATASLGLVLAPADGATADALLRRAGIALGRAKAAGRATWRRFHPDMDQALRARRSLEADLRRAIAEDALELHYQPLFGLRLRRVVGLEALMRWRHPGRGWISPADFIPVAEQSGLIVPLGEWALRRAARDARRWPGEVGVAVNVSPLQFRSPRLADAVLEALAESGLPAGRMEIEVTESTLLDGADATLAVLHRLRAAGLRVAMDDFGTGYSSLATLSAFPFDKIKIDQSFVRGPAAGGPQAKAIVSAVARLAAALGMRCTAEGVETEEQSARLEAAGCTELQGYLFSPPRPAAEVPALIERLSAGAAAAA